MTEDQLQSQCFLYWHNTYPQYRKLLWSVPNGGARDKKEAAKLKATGTVKGVHDLHMLFKGQFYTFELKVGSNTLSDEQIEFWDKITAHGAICHEIRTFEKFVSIITQILNQPCSNLQQPETSAKTR